MVGSCWFCNRILYLLYWVKTRGSGLKYVSKCLRKNWSKFAWLLQDVLCVYVCIHAHFMESRGRGLGGVLSLSFKLLIRLGNDKPLLRAY